MKFILATLIVALIGSSASELSAIEIAEAPDRPAEEATPETTSQPEIPAGEVQVVVPPTPATEIEASTEEPSAPCAKSVRVPETTPHETDPMETEADPVAPVSTPAEELEGAD